MLFTPNQAILDELQRRSGIKSDGIKADDDAVYDQVHDVDMAAFVHMVARPGKPHDDASVASLTKTHIESAFIGSCTNGRMEDLRIAADILKGRKVAPGVVLKIVPTTDEIWREALDEGLIKVFKDAGALVSNAGCAGCAAGQVGQNGPEETTISTGNRNFAGKQGKGEVFLASPRTVAISAVAGYITDNIDDLKIDVSFESKGLKLEPKKQIEKSEVEEKPLVVEGRVWLIQKDDIDTDMIFHNRYLTITDINEMGQYAFDNLEGYEDFASKAKPGDIIVTGKNFGAGSSRQQAVDCFKALGIPCILAESYGAIYERNAINAAMPILTYDAKMIDEIELKNGDKIRVDFIEGTATNLDNGKSTSINPFYDVQKEIYLRGGLL